MTVEFPGLAAPRKDRAFISLKNWLSAQLDVKPGACKDLAGKLLQGKINDNAPTGKTIRSLCRDRDPEKALRLFSRPRRLRCTLACATACQGSRQTRSPLRTRTAVSCAETCSMSASEWQTQSRTRLLRQPCCRRCRHAPQPAPRVSRSIGAPCKVVMVTSRAQQLVVTFSS